MSPILALFTGRLRTADGLAPLEAPASREGAAQGERKTLHPERRPAKSSVRVL